MRLSLLALAIAVTGCASDASDDQMPPTSGRTDIDAWLANGSYKSWACEPAVHASRAPSPHGFNKICSNDLISAAAGGTGEWPKGAAAVKELYASATASTPFGYSVYLKTAEDSAGGANWYWYEATHSGNSVVDGQGDGGAPKAVCVSCHGAAGTNAMNTPSPGARDQVFTPVRP